MMRKTIYETNYDRLIKLGVVSNEGAIPEKCRRSQVGLNGLGGGTLTAS